ncbi:Uncharacterised protein [Edwardsiella hoshinae]|uniref:Uncharacterized protein n=1 Tax=Edwardsiella hoshinae TaxID=93378 RepID=A0A376DIM9_9GAMM|nr:hypothetical protein [Edwardsiella hoshinae]STC90002.1 Uncharacterised protein [Edwardsiella hoshinae]
MMSDITSATSLPPLERECYSAADAGQLDALTCAAIGQRLAFLGEATSPQESYLTGWIGPNPLVIIRNYQDKRGTSSGFLLSIGDEYRFSVQTITPRIPKLLLWATLRTKPKTLPLIALQNLAAGDQRLLPYRSLRDATLRGKMNQWWAEINDYLGIACWQQRHDYPQWQALAEQLSIARVTALQQWLQSATQPLEQDGDYAGRWLGDRFIASRAASEATPWPSLLLTERTATATISYLIGWLADEQGQPALALALRPRPEQPFFTLNRFDAAHLQRLHALFMHLWQQAASTQPHDA